MKRAIKRLLSRYEETAREAYDAHVAKGGSPEAAVLVIPFIKKPIVFDRGHDGPTAA